MLALTENMTLHTYTNIERILYVDHWPLKKDMQLIFDLVIMIIEIILIVQNCFNDFNYLNHFEYLSCLNYLIILIMLINLIISFILFSFNILIILTGNRIINSSPNRK